MAGETRKWILETKEKNSSFHSEKIAVFFAFANAVKIFSN